MNSSLDKLSKALRPHDRIGIDFDSTLVGGQHSDTIQQYVSENPHKQYFIITFRTVNEASSLNKELMDSGNLSLRDFERIVTCPERLASIFWEERLDAIKMGATKETEKLLHWKGFVCKRLGCTILLDDMPDLVTRGTDKFRVNFVDARTL